MRRIAQVVSFLALFSGVGLETAEAKKVDFSTMNLGVAFFGNVVAPPNQSFTGSVTTTRSPKLAFESGGELVMVSEPEVHLRALFGMGSFGVFSSDGRDGVSAATFSQSGNGNYKFYGGKLSWNLWMSKESKRRLYLGGGGGVSNLTTHLQRTYANGNSYTADATASGIYWEAHGGWALVIVQNWSFGLEGGYRHLSYGDLEYSGDRDLRGNLLTGSKKVVDEKAKEVSVSANKFYLEAYFSLIF